MSRGKYLSLEEARKQGKLEQFAKEHPSESDSSGFKSFQKLMQQGAKRRARFRWTRRPPPYRHGRGGGHPRNCPHVLGSLS